MRRIIGNTVAGLALLVLTLWVMATEPEQEGQE